MGKIFLSPGISSEPEEQYLKLINNLLMVLEKHATKKDLIIRGKKKVPRELRILFQWNSIQGDQENQEYEIDDGPQEGGEVPQ